MGDGSELQYCQRQHQPDQDDPERRFAADPVGKPAAEEIADDGGDDEAAMPCRHVNDRVHTSRKARSRFGLGGVKLPP